MPTHPGLPWHFCPKEEVAESQWLLALLVSAHSCGLATPHLAPSARTRVKSHSCCPHPQIPPLTSDSRSPRSTSSLHFAPQSSFWAPTEWNAGDLAVVAKAVDAYLPSPCPQLPSVERTRDFRKRRCSGRAWPRLGPAPQHSGARAPTCFRLSAWQQVGFPTEPHPFRENATQSLFQTKRKDAKTAAGQGLLDWRPGPRGRRCEAPRAEPGIRHPDGQVQVLWRKAAGRRWAELGIEFSAEYSWVLEVADWQSPPPNCEHRDAWVEDQRERRKWEPFPSKEERELGTNNCGSDGLRSEHTALGSLLRTVKSPHLAPGASGGQGFGLRSDFRDKVLGQRVSLLRPSLLEKRANSILWVPATSRPPVFLLYRQTEVASPWWGIFVKHMYTVGISRTKNWCSKSW